MTGFLSGRKKNKTGTVLFSFLLGLCLFFVWNPAITGSSVVHAAEKRTVRVAFFPMDGFNVKNADGSLTGMDVEYLNALCEYANWEIEYVECDSWDDALRLLEEQKVDLVGSAQYSVERSQIFRYADLSSGYTFGVIASNADSSLAYEDFDAMREAVFGMVKTYVRREEFLRYLSDNGVENPVIKEYDSSAELQDALNRGEIDALVHTFTEIKEGQRLLGRFAPRPFYYISYPGNDDVMWELNQAIADLLIHQPELESELMNRFYQSRLDKTVVYTTEEKAYMKEAGEIVVGYLDGYYPFSYEEDGEYKGLTRELLEDGVASIGLSLSYEKMESLREAENALREGVIDVISYCADDGEALSKYQLVSVREYAEIPLVIVMQKDDNLSSAGTLATVSYLSSEAGLALDMDSVSVVNYDTQQDCLDALRKGTADAALCDGYLAEYLLGTVLRYNKLEVKNVLSGAHKVSMVIRKEENSMLEGILSKTIPMIDAKMINDYMLENDVYSLVSVDRFVRNHSFLIISGLLLIAIAVILVMWHIVQNNRKIQKLMYKDTGMDIWNLNYLIYKGEAELLQERKEQYAVAYLNVSQFRRYNVIYGWKSGHKLLESVADVLLKNVDSRKEICARDQGDRFVLLLALEHQEKFMERLKALQNDIEDRIFQDTESRMSIMIGAYFIPQESNDLRVAVDYASQAVDFIRDGLASDIKIYDVSMEQMIKERHKREKLLESVDIQKDFAAYYQAKVDIRNGKVIGAEALIRFMDPSAQGMVRAPGYFVPYYEQTGRVTEIDFFVLESVCRMLRRRLDEGKEVVRVSCNFSRIHFMKPGFPERFEETLERYGISKDLIEVEITETLVVEELQQQNVKEVLDILSEKGVRISIDDFGSGYSSLGVLEQIPASVIKLDRSFLLNHEDRERQVKIMKGIVSLAEEMNAQIVCEGVETEEDVELMREIGAYVAQGYRYCKPIPENAFEQMLSQNAGSSLKFNLL